MADDAPKTGFLARLRAKLNQGDSFLTRDVRELIPAGRALDDDVLDELETRLLLADCGVDATRKIINALNQRARKERIEDADAALNALSVILVDLLRPVSRPLVVDPAAKPYVILVVGVNGSGKTTTIGKLAARFREDGKSVMLAAGDTFRAAAIEQLVAWGERNQVPVIAQTHGADPAAVAFDALEAARARRVDVLIVDTAGRLHTKHNLMEELRKVNRVLGKAGTGAPHEVLLVLDGTGGQNALAQARQFDSAVPVTGIALTKLDGTAKGGVLFALAEQAGVPIRYIGVGEKADDLGVFDADDYVAALLEAPR
ncbi:MAG: signal recognition particle-docking protein FtsY [Gammaproteobacteria bacterium]